ncbi:MAG: Asp-tRNA(Asn)/Glu-tRNA(Gln) amidotransferase GatCAB subunit A, partial [Planctomycetaceae bacterium]|nr:Asp-tRNA(Asn)/Glu-tRNA(Gln) amidotransferase GatCAB subunit A [Planctomycetaceae bacterium]
MSELHLQSTDSLLSSLRSGALTSRKLTEHYLARIERLNPQLNAFVHITPKSALAQADEIDARRAAGEPVGLLQGLPVGIKDNMCRQGEPVTCGSRMLENFRPPYDAHVIERLKAEDGVIVGSLNMDEFAMGSSTETSIQGSVRNPWNPECSAGGSSGGSAAAVAAGLVPLALGS